MSKLFGEIGTYFADMFRHTVGKLTGFLSIVLGLAPVVYPNFFEGDRGILHARAVWWGASAIAFFLASLAAWNEQHKALLDCQMELEERMPKFELTIVNLNREYNSERDQSNYMFSVILLNRGAASVAVAWGAIYRREGEPEENMSMKYVAKPYVLTQSDGKVILTNASMIQMKTLSNPLNRGDARTGRILFTLPGNRMGIKDFNIEISCYDFMHQKCSAPYSPAPGYTTGIQFFPDEQVEATSLPVVPDVPIT